MRSILVLSGKGGCGKSTIATNLAAASAVSGRRTALAEMDRQKSAAGWLASRPASAARIEGLDWRREQAEPPAGLDRLVIDVQAGLRLSRIDDLLRDVDLVLVPVAPSPFDEASTQRLVRRLADLKPLRRDRLQLRLVASRVRPRSRAARRQATFLAELGYPTLARLSERVVYADLAGRGLGLFDVDTPATRAARAEWLPILDALEALG
jgi:chromosome partitioning protein